MLTGKDKRFYVVKIRFFFFRSTIFTIQLRQYNVVYISNNFLVRGDHLKSERNRYD